MTNAPPDRRVVASVAELMLAADPTTTTAEVATALGVSRRTVERSVQATLNRSFRGLRNQMLLSRLAELTHRFPDGSIKQIAYELGYAHPGSLSRHVRKLTGLSPKAFCGKS